MKFLELSPEAQEKAIENNFEINVDYDWWRDTCEDAARVGIEIEEFDLYHGSHIYGKLTEYPITVAESIAGEHGDECETFRIAIAFLAMVRLRPENDDYPDGYTEDERDNFKDNLLSAYYNILNNEWNYLTGRDAIIDALECDFYEFNEDGEII